MWSSSSTHGNSAIKAIADKGLQLDMMSNNDWQRKDAAQTKLIMKERGLGGLSFGDTYIERQKVPSKYSCKLRLNICSESWDHTAVCWSSRPDLSASFQANCKWVPTSGLEYAAQLSVSTNRGQPGLTVTQPCHMLTQTPPEALGRDSNTEDKGMGSIWPGITAFKRKKEHSREENLDDSGKKWSA